MALGCHPQTAGGLGRGGAGVGLREGTRLGLSRKEWPPTPAPAPAPRLGLHRRTRGRGWAGSQAWPLPCPHSALCPSRTDRRSVVRPSTWRRKGDRGTDRRLDLFWGPSRGGRPVLPFPGGTQGCLCCLHLLCPCRFRAMGVGCMLSGAMECSGGKHRGGAAQTPARTPAHWPRLSVCIPPHLQGPAAQGPAPPRSRE